MASAPRVLIDCHVIDWLCCATPIQRQIKRDQKIDRGDAGLGKRYFLFLELFEFLASDVALNAANGTEEQPF